MRVIAVLLLAAAVVACDGPGSDEPVVEVTRGNFEDVLVVRGRLEAKETAYVQAGAHGKISFMIPQGKFVKEGEPVFGLETTQAEENLDSALLDQAVSEANLAKAIEDLRIDAIKNELSLTEKRSQLEFSQLKADESHSDLEKVRRQVELKIVPRSDVPKAELGLRQAELNVENARIALKRLEEEIASRAETLQLDRQSAQAQLDKSQSKVEQARDYLSKATAVAPCDGFVVHAKNWNKKTWQVGDQVWRSSTVIEIPDMSAMRVTAEVNEVDIPRVVADLACRVRVEAFPDRLLEAKVLSVSGLASEVKDHEGRGTGVRVFDVKFEFTEQDQRLRPGMTATVEVILSRHEDVVLVPVAAIAGSGDDTHVRTPSGRRVPVSVVAVGVDEAVIGSGLEPGDRVALLPGDATDDPVEADEPADESAPETAATPARAVAGIAGG